MKECIILAGGLGTRLREVVSDVPKCMAEVAGQPFLYYLLEWCRLQSFSKVILSVGYKSEVIIDWVNSKKYPFDIAFAIEEQPLGTGGAIKLAMQSLSGDRATVINGDTFFDVDIDTLYAFHMTRDADITLALKPMEYFDRYGSVKLDQNNRIIAFNEKQHCDKGLINGGVYLIDKKIFLSEEINLPEKFSFEKGVLEAYLTRIPIYGSIQDKYFIDIGIPEGYKKANIDFAKFRI